MKLPIVSFAEALSTRLKEGREAIRLFTKKNLAESV